VPPIPAWTSLHPLIIHFPIALLFVAPLFIVAAAFWRRHREGWTLGALALMGIGTLSLFFAVATGEAAGQLVERTPQITATLERHEALAETGRVVFSLLTLAFATWVLVPLVLKREPGAWVRRTVTVLFLLAYAGGISHLTRVAHEGGRLVHEFGVRSIIAATDPDTASPGAGSPQVKTRDEDHH
jgi:uncharacterized membrane protein